MPCLLARAHRSDHKFLIRSFDADDAERLFGSKNDPVVRFAAGLDRVERDELRPSITVSRRATALTVNVAVETYSGPIVT